VNSVLNLRFQKNAGKLSSVQITGGLSSGAESLEFESQWGQELSLPHIIQTGSGAHPTSYPVGTGGSA
jgi:hypothetical protein